MHVGMILEMASDNLGERTALGSSDGGVTFGRWKVAAATYCAVATLTGPKPGC